MAYDKLDEKLEEINDQLTTLTNAFCLLTVLPSEYEDAGNIVSFSGTMFDDLPVFIAVCCSALSKAIENLRSVEGKILASQALIDAIHTVVSENLGEEAAKEILRNTLGLSSRADENFPKRKLKAN